ncbi:MAG: hypothetical protein FJX74_05445 [Armatimonadetes bacterium]|nr:hypothetical protein [Armatimonadota bacterium]
MPRPTPSSQLPDADGTPDPRGAGVTCRILVLAGLLVPLNAFFVLFMSYERSIYDPTLVALFWNVLFLLVVVRLINQALLRWRPAAAFSPAELLVLWVLMAVATSGAGLDSMQCTFLAMQGAFRFASPENHWESLFLKQIPAALTVSQTGALDRIWLGGASLLEARNLTVWAGPVARWWALMTILWAAPIGLIQLLRKRWIEQEKMGFPIVHLPMELASHRVHWLRSPVFWCAAAVPVLINLLGGLHTYWPAVPSLPTAMWDARLDMGRYLVAFGRPWNAASYMLYTCLYPFIIGLGLLLPGELCLSLWFFFLFWRVEKIGAAWLGLQAQWDSHYDFAAGGYIALVGFPLYAARRQLAGLLSRAWRRDAREPGEPLSPGAAVGIFLAGFVVLVGIGVSAGLGLPVAAAFFTQYFVMAVIIGRIRAEMGLPTHELERWGPAWLQSTILGPRVLGLQNMTTLSLFYGFTRGMRNIPLPHQFEGLYFASRTKLDGRRLLLATVPFIALGLAWAWFWTLFLSHNRGLGTYRGPFHTWFAQETWTQLAAWLNADAPMAWGRLGQGAIGFAAYWGLMALRSRWIAWPLHPAGFALSTTWYMSHMWFPMFIAWSLKAMVARWGGLSAVRALPIVAYGLILGDVGTGALWIIYAMVRHVPAYAFWQ